MQHTAEPRRSIDPKKVPPLSPIFLSDLRQFLNAKPAPLVIEIGCGVGLHPIQFASANPDKRVLAIERTTEKFSKFARRLEHHQHIQNIFAAHADAAVLLPQAVPSASTEQVFTLYPNPYPKGRHKNLRLAFSPLTNEITRVLKPGGMWTVSTNRPDYRDELLENIPKQLPFTMVEFNEARGPKNSYRSHFEKKYLERGEACWTLDFRREPDL